MKLKKEIEKNIAWKKREHVFQCPACLEDREFLNLESTQIGYCPDCNISWTAGINLVSDWEKESMEKWQNNFDFLKRFKLVDDIIKQVYKEKFNIETTVLMG